MTGDILVVDDTPANIRLLHAILTAHGHPVRVASSGEEALAVIKGASPPDLVLLDVQMPGMNGYEVCRRIREDEIARLIPIIMITASGAEEKVRGLESGADDFIPRPFDQSELLARVRSLLRMKSYHDTMLEQAAELSAWNRVLEEQVAEQVEEVHRLQRLRRFLSDHVADAVLSAGDESLLQPHRREVSLMFCDLRGFTPFATASEPEDVLTALQEFHAVVGEVVARHAATVGYFAGDGVMMFFNDPIACDDPALRAVSAAVELRDAMGPLAARWRGRGRELGVGTGIAYGFATIGLIGFKGRYEYTAVGTVANVASRLCDEAAAGEILMTQRAYAATNGRISASERGPVALRGLDAPTVVWAVALTTEPLAPVAPQTSHEAPAEHTPLSPAVARTGSLEIRVLGTTRLLVDGVELPLRSRKIRELAGLLVAQRDEVVTVDRLIDQMWDGHPPDSATATLRVYVSRLRKLLSGVPGHVLATRPTGYQLELPGDALDVVHFERLAASGRSALAGGDPEQATRLLREALRLWRGHAYADLASSPAVATERARLDEGRLEAHEDCIDAEIACGRHRRVIGELDALVAENPLRERLWAQRMTALYRSGRQAEALAAYQAMRHYLATELGLDPSPPLVDLHEKILARAIPAEV